MRHAVEHYFGGGSELLNMHERLADLLLIALSVSFEDAGKDCVLVPLPSNVCVKLLPHSQVCQFAAVAANVQAEVT